MVRDLDRLRGTTFDLLVIGGGIHGLAAAYEAAARGLSVALVDRGDFGGGSTFNHQRTVHGGLRSLQSMSLGRALEAIGERRTLARIAPRLVAPQPFLLPTRRQVKRSRLACRLAFGVVHLLERGRDGDIEQSLRLPRGQIVSRVICERLFPYLPPGRVTGGAMWYDYQMPEADRLTLAFAEAAFDSGAVLANYVEAVEPIRNETRVAGVWARDLLGEARFEVKATVTLNAAGAYAGRWMEAFGARRPLPLVKAMNLVTTRPAGQVALVSPTPAGRMLTLVPWQGRALVGTGHSDRLVEPHEGEVSDAELDGFIAEANEAFAGFSLKRDEVSLVHRGLVPATASRPPGLLSAAAVIDHRRDGIDGAVTMIGVKYSTARRVAERTINTVASKLKRPAGKSRTARVSLPGAEIADYEAIARETTHALKVQIDAAALQQIMRVYGSRCPAVIRLVAARPELSARVVPESPVIAAQVVHAVRAESACTLADVVMRRTALGVTGYPGDDAAAAVAGLMAAELGWDRARIDRELDALTRLYLPVASQGR